MLFFRKNPCHGMELVPFEQGAEPIKIGSGVKKVTLGRAEIKKSLNTKEKIRVSKDQIRLEINHENKTIQIETLGVNPSSYGKFGDPPKPLKKDNQATGNDSSYESYFRSQAETLLETGSQKFRGLGLISDFSPCRRCHWIRKNAIFLSSQIRK